jgi:starch phosphorylase
MEIIYEINERFLAEVQGTLPQDRLGAVSLIEEGPERHVRMANLATVGSFRVNGVAELHTHLMRTRTFRDFARLWPDKFQNKTNGVTPRRFLRIANPRLSRLLDARLGTAWMRDLEVLRGLEPLADDPRFRRRWREIKLRNKRELANLVDRTVGLPVDPASLFDVLAKRLHEYKRQLLKVLHIVTMYHRILDEPGRDILPRTFLFAAKAAPGYEMAKRIIKLIHAVGAVINQDPKVDRRLRVAFLPNFNVTLAQEIYPAADLSEQISVAGKEASGTGNMKFALNGALTVGTLDGANIEIRERVGENNFFLFGLTAEEAMALREGGYDPRSYYEADPELKRAVDALGDGTFSSGDKGIFRPIVDSLLDRDEYLLLADYAAYVAIQDRIDTAFRDTERWTRMSILNAARCGYFSSDRTIREYCRDIWQVEAVPVPE